MMGKEEKEDKRQIQEPELENYSMPLLTFTGSIQNFCPSREKRA